MTDFSERIRPGAVSLIDFIILIKSTLKSRDVIIICVTKYTKFFVAVLFVICGQIPMPYPGVVTEAVFSI
jgi:hypothetical protein